MPAQSSRGCIVSSPAPNGSRLHFGAFDLDLNTGELHKLGHAVHLRPQAAKVLTVLAAHGGEIVTREQLSQEVWGKETFVDFERGLNLCIREVRAALSDDAETPRYIETLPKRGYRFIAPIERETAASTEARQPLTMGVRRRALWPLYAGIAVAVLTVLFLANPGNWRDRILPGPPIHTIAVLPLNNLSGDSAQDYF